VSGHRIKHNRFHLPDIPGEIIYGEQGCQFRRVNRFFLLEGFCRFIKKIIQQYRDIIESLPQRGDMDLMGTKPEVEVVAELSASVNLRRSRFVVAMILYRLPWGYPNNRIVFLFLEQAEKLHLGHFRKITDFVKKRVPPDAWAMRPPVFDRLR
jgi:hypothetical protein